MNKVILGLVLAVCVLGLALVMLNERLGRKTDSYQTSPSTQAMAENRASPETSLADSSSVSTFTPPPTVTAPESMQADAQDLPDSISAREKALNMEMDNAGEALAPPPIERTPGNNETDINQSPAAKPKTETAAPQSETKPVPAPKPEAKPAPAPKPEVKPAPKPETKANVAREETDKARKPAAAGDKTIKRFIIYSRDKGATVRIGGDTPIHYTNMTLDNPDRVVLDMDGQWQFPDNPGIPRNEIVNNVRIGKNGDKTRVVIDLKGKPRSVRVLPAKNGASLDVRIDK